MIIHLKYWVLLTILFISNLTHCQKINITETYPWCIVAYDSEERTPSQRIEMMKGLGFTKYAYDWRDRHLNDSKKELILARENNIEILSVWLWLNAKRDSINKLSPANEKIFKIVEELKLETTFWISLSENFFKGLNDRESLEKATKYIEFVCEKAQRINCKVALYNHSGWFGDPLNEIEIIKSLPNYELSLVYNFHHGRNDINNFKTLASKLTPYLSAVNLNGMIRSGEKIQSIGSGDFEKIMIQTLRDSGFNGPWGILGHVENTDVKLVLKNNIEGLNSLFKN